MRLRDYQNLLEESITNIKKLSMTIVKNNTNYGKQNEVKVTGLIIFNNTVAKLEEANLFQDVITNIRKIEYFNNRANDFIVVQEGEYNNLSGYRNQLLTQIQQLKNTIDNILSVENENSLNIKLPNDIQTITELKDFIANLDLVFHVFKEFSCEVEFKGVETGSAWLTVVISALVAAKPCVDFLFDVAEKSLKLRNLKLEGDRKLLEIEELKSHISQQEYQSFCAARKAKNEEEYQKIKIELSQTALNILKSKEQKIINENEVLEKTKISLEKMGELLDRGMEILPAFNAPEETKAISAQFNEKLEDHKKLMIGITSQKLIEQKEEMEKPEETENNEENINE